MAFASESEAKQLLIEKIAARAVAEGRVSSMRDGWGPATVPVASYFALGENRDNSRDSRFWGFVPDEDLLGRASVIYWSWDSTERRIRWERIGRRLR